MGWTQADIPDLNGKTAVVTGANGGLGLASTLALAGAGAHVVMAARNQEKATHAVAEVRSAHPDASVEVVELDLADLASVKAATTAITVAHPSIDILLNNAGLMAMPERRTADGFEMQFGVNHLGHWVFTAGLLPALLRSNAARVVTVSSTVRHVGRAVNPDNPHLEGSYKPWLAYGQAKLANYHFGLGLNEQFEAAGVRASSLVAHPGLSNTDLQSTTVAEGGGGGKFAPMAESMASATGMSPEQGSRPQLRAATDPRAKGGELYGPRFVSNGPPVKLPVLRKLGMAKAIDTLWQVSERETGVALNVAAVAADLDG